MVRCMDRSIEVSIHLNERLLTRIRYMGMTYIAQVRYLNRSEGDVSI